MILSLRRMTLAVLLLSAGATTPVHAEKRVALVIGNATYQQAAPLKNPKNDASAMASRLGDLGFEVVHGTDLTHSAMLGKLREFAHKLEGADVAVLFYAGHGLQVSGRNYLAPIDAQLKTELDLEFEAVRVETILAQMERSARTNIVLLDACRDNPLARNLATNMGTRSTAIGRGLARVDMGVGTLIAFATQPGNVAEDGKGANSPFTAAMLKHIDTPGLDISVLMRQVRQDVIAATGGRQVPWDNSSLTAPFMFKHEQSKPIVQTPPQPDAKAIEQAYWQAAQDSGAKQAYEAYLQKFPNGEFAEKAQTKLETLAKTELAAEEERKKQETARSLEAETARKLEEERAKLRAAEEQRQAKEREEFAKKLAEIEARLKQQTQLAALTPDEKKAPDTQPAPITDPKLLTLAVKNELKRVGCDPGEVNSNWDGKARGALAEFNKHAKLNLPGAAPTMATLDAIRSKSDLVCPEPKKIVQPEKQKTTPGQPTAQKERKPDAPSSGGICFGFNNAIRPCSDPDARRN